MAAGMFAIWAVADKNSGMIAAAVDTVKALAADSCLSLWRGIVIGQLFYLGSI
jgi:hypothetical protein